MGIGAHNLRVTFHRLHHVWVRRAAPYVVLGLIAAVPAFYLLGDRGFWGDEVWQTYWAQLYGWPAIFQRFMVPPDLPIPILLTKLALLAGQSEFAARLPSALAAIGSVLLTYRIGRQLLDRWSGAAALTFCTSGTPRKRGPLPPSNSCLLAGCVLRRYFYRVGARSRSLPSPTHLASGITYSASSRSSLSWAWAFACLVHRPETSRPPDTSAPAPRRRARSSAAS